MQEPFDPITNGHIDIINRSLTFCDKLYVTIGINPNKKTLFPTQDRIELIEEVKESTSAPSKIEVAAFNGLLIDFAKQIEANILIRGIRSVSDFEYELTLAGVNKVLSPTMETIFLPTSPDLAVVSSSMVKEIFRHQGDVSKFVPDAVLNALRDLKM